MGRVCANAARGACRRSGQAKSDRSTNKDQQARSVTPVPSVDRLGRSLTDLLGVLQELHAKGVDLYLHQQGLDTSTPSGRAMFQMMGVFAEFERAMIRERVMAGLARAKAEGTRLGRQPTVTNDAAKVRAIQSDRAAGKSLRTIAQEHGVGHTTVARICAEAVP